MPLTLSHTTRKEVKRNDRMDYRSVLVECHLGTHVYRAVRGAGVDEVFERKRRFDGEQERSDGSRNGYSFPADSRQQVILFLSSPISIRAVATDFYFTIDSEAVSLPFAQHRLMPHYP